MVSDCCRNEQPTQSRPAFSTRSANFAAPSLPGPGRDPALVAFRLLQWLRHSDTTGTWIRNHSLVQKALSQPFLEEIISGFCTLEHEHARARVDGVGAGSGTEPGFWVLQATIRAKPSPSQGARNLKDSDAAAGPRAQPWYTLNLNLKASHSHGDLLSPGQPAQAY